MQHWKKHKNLFFLSGLIIIFSLLIFKTSPDHFFSKTFYFSFMGFAILLLLPKADSISVSGSRFSRAVTFISIISYSMYLTNSIVALLFRKYFSPETASLSLMAYFFYLFTVIFISFFVYRFYEKPMMDIRDK